MFRNRGRSASAARRWRHCSGFVAEERASGLSRRGHQGLVQEIDRQGHRLESGHDFDLIH